MPLQDGGTVVVGPDGDMYYIDDNQLAQFQLTPQQADQIKNTLWNSNQYKGLLGQIPAPLAKQLGLKASDDEATVTDASIGCFRQPC